MIPRLVEETPFSHYVVVSDDVVVSQAALDAVLTLLPEHPVVTGYCNLTEGDDRVNLSRAPASPSNGEHWYRQHEVAAWPDEPVPSYFAGMSLSGMSRETWRRFPFRAFPLGMGCCSDSILSRRLAAARVPIVAPKDGWVRHLKTREPEPNNEQKRLLVGEIDAEVRHEV